MNHKMAQLPFFIFFAAREVREPGAPPYPAIPAAGTGQPNKTDNIQYIEN
jgi:hypothetical protein